MERTYPPIGALGLALLGGGPDAIHPPIGARGLAPQNTCEPSIPIRWTNTMLMIIDLAVAFPTPTGPPVAV